MNKRALIALGVVIGLAMARNLLGGLGGSGGGGTEASGGSSTNAVSDARYVLKSGSTMTGALTLTNAGAGIPPLRIFQSSGTAGSAGHIYHNASGISVLSFGPDLNTTPNYYNSASNVVVGMDSSIDAVFYTPRNLLISMKSARAIFQAIPNTSVEIGGIATETLIVLPSKATIANGLNFGLGVLVLPSSTSGITTNGSLYGSQIPALPLINVVQTAVAARSHVIATVLLSATVTETARADLMEALSGTTNRLAMVQKGVGVTASDMSVLSCPIQPSATYWITNLSVGAASAMITNFVVRTH